MKRADFIFTTLLMASVMEGVVMANPDARAYVPGVVMFLMPAINAGIAVWLKQLLPFLSPGEANSVDTPKITLTPQEAAR